MDVLARLLEKTIAEGDCYVWQGAVSNTNQPVLNDKTWGMRYARQLAYKCNGGTLETNKTLHSTCCNPRCINPTHLTYTHTKEMLYAEFMAQVNLNGGPPPDASKAHLGQCHLWTGCYNKGCRPAISREKWGEYIAARWIYMFVKGIQLSPKITVNHRCNNAKCVNPAHLYHTEGETFNKTNMRQAIDDGRLHNQKFNFELAKLIRQRIANGERTSDLCKEYKCSKPTIASIKYNRTFCDPTYEPPLVLSFQ